MKKYVIFAVSFVLLFSLLQMLSGMVLTYTYTPEIEKAWELSATLPQETVIKGSQHSFLLTFVIAFLSATIAYVIPKKVSNKSNIK